MGDETKNGAEFLVCKVELSVTWHPNCVLRNLVGASTFTITDQNFMFELLLYQQKTMQNYQNY